ncbi:MAG TPA: TOPRIM nucleotidyl transferase/hydrolase domain-containing protein [Gaiellaceae bacterium]
MLLDRVAIHGYRGARDVALEPGAMCALVGESSSGKSTVLAAIWTLLEAAAPMPTLDDVSHGETRVHIEAVSGDRTLFLDARPPATLNLNREGAPPALFFPANLRPTTVLAPTGRAAAKPVELVQRALPRHAGHWADVDGGVALVHAMEGLVQTRARGLVVLIEEPELYLGPSAQRHLHDLLRRLAARGRNQVLLSTHAPVFLGVDRLDELVLVRHVHGVGTVLVQPQPLTPEQSFRVLSEFDAERAELFLSRAVLLVEGRTEKIALPFVFERLGHDADREAIAVVDCAGKGNIPLFAEICNACGIPYVVLHDRDAARGELPAEAERIANETILRVAGRRRTVTLVPDFEGVAGLHARRAKPEHAWRRFRGPNAEVPAPLRQAVERVVAAARKAPRTTVGA